MQLSKIFAVLAAVGPAAVAAQLNVARHDTSAYSVEYITIVTTVCGNSTPTAPPSYAEPETTIRVTSKVTATVVTTVHGGNSTVTPRPEEPSHVTQVVPPPSYVGPTVTPPASFTPSSVGTIKPTISSNYTQIPTTATPSQPQYTGAAEENKPQVGCVLMAAAVIGAAVNLL